MTLSFFSSGGVGDALIVGLKISKIEYEKRMTEPKVPIIYWDHFERHECHKWAISEIMNKFVSNKEMKICKISKTPEADAINKCKLFNGMYLDTKVKCLESPYLASKIGERFILPWKENISPHIVISMVAGRAYDNTKRTIDTSIVHQVANRFPNKRIVLLGPEIMDEEYKEFEKYYDGRVYPCCGRTETIIDAFSFINDCCLFIGQDGALAYYAMMLRKPTIVHFHIDSLINHYFNKEWAKHSIAFIGEGNNFKSLELNHPETQTLLEMVEKYE